MEARAELTEADPCFGRTARHVREMQSHGQDRVARPRNGCGGLTGAAQGVPAPLPTITQKGRALRRRTSARSLHEAVFTGAPMTPRSDSSFQEPWIAIQQRNGAGGG